MMTGWSIPVTYLAFARAQVSSSPSIMQCLTQDYCLMRPCWQANFWAMHLHVTHVKYCDNVYVKLREYTYIDPKKSMLLQCGPMKQKFWIRISLTTRSTEIDTSLKTASLAGSQQIALCTVRMTASEHTAYSSHDCVAQALTMFLQLLSTTGHPVQHTCQAWQLTKI